MIKFKLVQGLVAEDDVVAEEDVCDPQTHALITCFGGDEGTTIGSLLLAVQYIFQGPIARCGRAEEFQDGKRGQ